MTVTSAISISPRNIVTGQSIKVYDNSTCSGEVITKIVIYIDEQGGASVSNGSYDIGVVGS